MIKDLPYICDDQVGYSAGGYSLSPRWFLTWCVYPFFQNKLHWWVMILHKTYDHWSVAVLTVTVHFIYFHFWFFFKLVAFCTEFNLFTPFVLFPFMIMDLPYICWYQRGTGTNPSFPNGNPCQKRREMVSLIWTLGMTRRKKKMTGMKLTQKWKLQLIRKMMILSFF